jgi:hypothetical protein
VWVYRSANQRGPGRIDSSTEKRYRARTGAAGQSQHHENQNSLSDPSCHKFDPFNK